MLSLIAAGFIWIGEKILAKKRSRAKNLIKEGKEDTDE